MSAYTHYLAQAASKFGLEIHTNGFGRFSKLWTPHPLYLGLGNTWAVEDSFC